MDQKIQKYLKDIEQQYEIKILLACETGSRAWGFPSTDSDYDVRIIYMHPKDWYLSLSEKKDTLEIMLENNEIDISGWDLRKCLRLLSKSNPPLLERIQSPIIYQVDNQFLTEINNIAKLTYSKIATMHHYLSMAKKIIAEMEDQEKYKLKKFFYALRASVACKWILEKEVYPPIQFPVMLTELAINDSLKNRITELIQLKATIQEDYWHSKEFEIIDFMKECVQEADSEATRLPSSKFKRNVLDDFFLNTLE